MNLPVFQVDAFAAGPFQGNPAAVCILEETLSHSLMQAIAAEMNLSETAFLLRAGEEYDLRWFTPVVEVNLCGHATLASAHVLWSEGYLDRGEEARFRTHSGRLQASARGEWIDLDFPQMAQEPCDPPDGLLEALGVVSLYVGKSDEDLLVEVDTAAAVREIKPDFAKLERVTPRGVIVTSRSDSPEFDFVSRFFAPAVGINEDPVTGSAHCCLAPYWGGKLNKGDMTACQASRRGGTLGLSLRGERVFISGRAVTVVQGRLII
jgi:predicted PhzF superfamily epimerase YddE/YHI9